LPKGSDADKAARTAAIQAATCRAIDAPLAVMEASLASMEVIKAMAEHGMEASASDAGVAALCARTAVIGAHLNVKINAASLADKDKARQYLARGAEIEGKAVASEKEILAIVEGKIKI
jgi:glutamate formiminotransferase/formiminotetrahydrofolate cyclodeaminase